MGPRILLVTRRFWPLAAPEEMKLLERVDAWRREGAEVSVVTPQWDRSWPSQLVVREMRVTRLPYAAKRLWGGYWYLRRLSQWLRQSVMQFDVVVAWRLQLDAIATLRVCTNLRKPVVVLYEGCGESGDASGLRQSAYGPRILQACRSAAGIVAFDRAGHAEALGLGIDPVLCHCAGEIISLGESANQTRSASRLHLLESNRDLFTTHATPVGLTVSPLEDRSALAKLFLAWSQLRESHHDARLWWIGDGSRRSSLYSMLGDYDLRYHAVLPGDFDDFEDLFSGPNFYIASSPRAASLASMAMARGLGVIASDAVDVRAMLEQDAPVRYFHASDASDLARRLCEACDAPIATQQWGEDSRAWVLRSIGDAHEAAQRHLSMLLGRNLAASLK